jgi:hypothetical protein
VKIALGIFKGAEVQEVGITSGMTLGKVNNVHLYQLAEFSCISYNIRDFCFCSFGNDTNFRLGLQ